MYLRIHFQESFWLIKHCIRVVLAVLDRYYVGYVLISYTVLISLLDSVVILF